MALLDKPTPLQHTAEACASDAREALRMAVMGAVQGLKILQVAVSKCPGGLPAMETELGADLAEAQTLSASLVTLVNAHQVPELVSQGMLPTTDPLNP